MAKYKHYLFSPLLDEKGEPVVRIPNYDEYVMIDDIPVKVIWIPDSTGYKYPILTLKTFEEDPFRAIMEIGKQLKEIEETPGRNIIGEELYTKMWKAIIETMKCWGANTMVKRGVSNIPGPGILRKPRRSRIVGSQQEETG